MTFLEADKLSKSLHESSENDTPIDSISDCTDDFLTFWICFVLDGKVPKSLADLLPIFTLVKCEQRQRHLCGFYGQILLRW